MISSVESFFSFLLPVTAKLKNLDLLIALKIPGDSLNLCLALPDLF